MRRALRLGALGAGAFLVLLVVTAPAQLARGPLERFGVTATGLSGSLWQGRAAMVSVRGTPVSSMEWDLHVTRLLTGTAAADFSVKRSDGFIDGTIAIGRSGTITLTDTTASVPLSALASAGLPRGWNGNAHVRLAQAVVTNGVPMTVSGTVELVDLVGPANRPQALGSYRATFPAANAPADRLAGDIEDLDGPIDVTARLTIGRDRSFQLDGLVTTRPDAPPSLATALQYLGEADAEGRRPFSLAGTF